jgi:hypothetical protein
MSAHSVYEASIQGTGASATATALQNEQSKQSTIEAQRSVVGHHEDGNSSSSNLQTAVVAAKNNDFQNRLLLEQNRQKTIDAARQTLRATGDLSPF